MSIEKSADETNLEAEKQQQIERICEGAPDAIYLLSGVSEKVKAGSQEKIYKPGAYSDADWKGFMSGGKARAIAVAELASRFPEATVAVNSNTFNVNDKNAPTDAEVMADYLERKDVASERIVMQDRSTTTFTEMIELAKYIGEKKWRHPVVVAGETQLPRASEMWRQIDTLEDPAGASKDPVFREALEYIKTANPKITFVSSEDILSIRDSRYAEVIAAARKTELWQIREKLDAQAFDQLKKGLYWKGVK